MKKLSNRLSVKQSSTKEGQRELLREHTNAINELIDIINDMQGMKPYTAMRSTGEVFCQCEHPQPRFAGLSNVIQYCMLCSRQISKQTTPVCCHCEKDVNKLQSGATGEPPYGTYPIKSQEDDFLDEPDEPHTNEGYKPLAIVKGE